MIRRLALAVGLSVLLVLGFGAAYGVSSALTGESLLGVLQGHTPVVICHKPDGPDNTIIVDDDAVPAHLAHGDTLGPCGGAVVTTTLTSATTTLTSATTTSVPITETDPPTTVTEPPTTISTGITVTVPVPPETTTVPGTSTIVTVPPAETVTVTVPGETVTQPPVTTTIPGGTTTIPGQTVTQPPVTTTTPGGTTTVPGGTTTVPGQTVTVPPQVIERLSETVTLPGATTTVVAGGTTTVVTVTGPNQLVHPGLVVKPLVQAKIKQARKLIRIAARIHRQRARVRYLVVKVVAVAQRTVIVVAASSCPPGTALSNGTCRPVVRGKG